MGMMGSMGIKMALNQEFSYFSKSNFSEVQIKNFTNAELHFFTMTSLKHEENEDAFGYLAIDNNLRFLFVADGMGGHAGGAKASEIICKNLERKFRDLKRYDDNELRNIIIDTIEESNSDINNLRIGAGSTFCGVIIGDLGSRFINCGDSMALHLGSRGKLKYKVLEHSPMGYAIESGLTTRQDSSVDSYAISNGLGFSPMWMEISEIIPYASNDIISVFSDSFLNHFSIDEMSQKLSSESFKERTRQLFEDFKQRDKDLLTDDTTLMLLTINNQAPLHSPTQEN